MSMLISKGASAVISDLLDVCCEVKPGDEVVIASSVDGLQGGDNLVDTQSIEWLYNAIVERGANPTVLWFEEPFNSKPMKWRVPPVFLAAERACDVFINNSFDLTIEELKIIQETATEYNVRLCRNYGTTVGLLNSPWLQTPYELVAEIRYEASTAFDAGINKPFQIDDPNGTHLTGIILPPSHPRFPTYSRYRKDGPGYLPFPEWVFPPINIGNVNGKLIFNHTLSWWSRYAGLPPVFDESIVLTIENSYIVAIEGGKYADMLKSFIKKYVEPVAGKEAYGFKEVHCGVHPNAIVPPQNCDNPMVQRIVSHSDARNIHFHIGAPWPSKDCPYWVHMTADIRNATWKVGDLYIHKDGEMECLKAPRLQAIADKYPDRPTLYGFARNY